MFFYWNPILDPQHMVNNDLAPSREQPRDPFPAHHSSKAGYTRHIHRLSQGSAVTKEFGQGILTSTSTSPRLTALGSCPTAFRGCLPHVHLCFHPHKVDLQCFEFTTNILKQGDLTKIFEFLAPLKNPEDLGSLGPCSFRQHPLSWWQLPHSEHRCSLALHTP